MSLTLLRRRSGTVAVAPSISIAPDDDTVSVTQGSTVAIVYTLTRNGGYTGTVTPAVTGLPSGVSGSWSDSSMTGADSTTTLTLTATGGATEVTNDAFTVTFSGSGVSDAVDGGTVTVVAAGYWLANLPGSMTKMGETYFEPGDVGYYPGGYGTAGLYADLAPTDANGQQYQSTFSGAPDGDDCWEIRIPEDQYAGGYGAGRLYDALDKEYTRLYCCIRARWDADYYTWREKLFYPLLETNGSTYSGYGHLSVGAEALFSVDPADAEHYFSFFVAGHPSYGNGVSPDTGLTISKGAWGVLEIDAKMNTPNTANGHLKVWWDGALVFNLTSLNMTPSGDTTNQTTMTGLRFDFTRGGGSSPDPTPAGGQSFWMNRLEWWGIE